MLRSLGKRAISAIVLLCVTQLSIAGAEGNGPHNGTHLTANEVRALGSALSTAVANGHVNESNGALRMYQVAPITELGRCTSFLFHRGLVANSHLLVSHKNRRGFARVRSVW
jgi:hypothetical protein